MWWQRLSVRTIAKEIGRSPSSISRELRRNFPAEHKTYTPRLAHRRALIKRKCRGRKERLKNDLIRNYVFEHLHWSVGKRQPDLNDQNYYNKFEIDKKMWDYRKNLILEERLKVNI